MSRSTVYALIRKGELEAVKVGRHTRIVVESIDEYIDHLRETRRDPPAARAPRTDTAHDGCSCGRVRGRVAPAGPTRLTTEAILDLYLSRVGAS